jgi:hypothetical protein
LQKDWYGCHLIITDYFTGECLPHISTFLQRSFSGLFFFHLAKALLSAILIKAGPPAQITIGLILSTLGAQFIH